MGMADNKSQSHASAVFHEFDWRTDITHVVFLGFCGTALRQSILRSAAAAFMSMRGRRRQPPRLSGKPEHVCFITQHVTRPEPCYNMISWPRTGQTCRRAAAASSSPRRRRSASRRRSSAASCALARSALALDASVAAFAAAACPAHALHVSQAPAAQRAACIPDVAQGTSKRCDLACAAGLAPAACCSRRASEENYKRTSGIPGLHRYSTFVAQNQGPSSHEQA